MKLKFDKWDFILLLSFLVSFGFLIWTVIGEDSPMKQIVKIFAGGFSILIVSSAVTKKSVDRILK